jgi:glycosyltransferase involved in cell wall biosynthesis
VRILFLSRWYPYPPDNGSKIRVFGLLRSLCERHEVTLISFRGADEQAAAPSVPGPVETRTCVYHEFRPSSTRARLAFASPTPRFLVDTFHAELDGLIRTTVARTRFDVVIASQLSMAAYHDAFRGVPAIFEEAELGAYRPGANGQPLAARLRTGLTWAKHRRYMARLLPHFACCTVASEVERQLMAEAVPGYDAVHVVPNAIETDAFPQSAPRTPGSLIFTGSLRYAPNREGMAWFVEHILPALRARVPGVRLTITGEADRAPFDCAPDIVLTGRVPDVRPLVAASAVSVAPLRSGGGTRLKILEAMAARTPVVATSKAAEGLDAVHGEHLLIADTPQAFVDAIERLLRNPEDAQAMADRAHGLCRARYDARTVASAFLRLVDQAAA